MDIYNVPRKLPFSRKILSAKVVLSYIFDYVIIIGLVAAFYALDAIEPFHQRFSLRNYTLRYPYAVHERVPIPLLLLVACLAPASVIAVYTLVIDGLFSTKKAGGRKTKYTFKSRLWELNCGVLGLLLGVGSAFVITGALKNAIGKPRPDLIDRCQPNLEQAQLFLAVGNYSLVGHDICTQADNAILKDGFRSFPSGHSSSAWAGLFYLSLYLGGKLHIFDSRGEVWKTFVILVPSLGAALIAGSRIMDARHHPFDVITGSLLGIATAWAAYRQYFPPLSDYRAKGRAYPIRTWGRISQGYEDAIPLQPNEAMGFVSGRESPSQQPSGNAFRDEINRSQRRRGDGPSSTDAPLPLPSHATMPQYSTGNAMANQRPMRRDDWDDSTDEEDGDMELQQTYTLSGGAGARYDPAPVFTAQETGYSAYRPSPMQAGAQAGDVGLSDITNNLTTPVMGSSSPPHHPPHSQPSRGVQLTESYVKP